MTNRTLFATLQKFLVVTSIFVLTGCTTNKQENSEWITLFNGKDLDDWVVKIQHYDVGVNFGNTFSVQDSVIDVRYDAYGEFNDRFGHLFYKTPFSKFHLKLEYRLAGALQPGAPSYTILNSGVMFHSQDPATIKKEQDWPISVEMQFLAGLEDGNERPTGNMCSPGTEIYYQGQKYNGHCLQSSSKTYQWRHCAPIFKADNRRWCRGALRFCHFSGGQAINRRVYRIAKRGAARAIQKYFS
jgi:hypothetical protein